MKKPALVAQAFLFALFIPALAVSRSLVTEKGWNSWERFLRNSNDLSFQSFEKSIIQDCENTNFNCFIYQLLTMKKIYTFSTTRILLTLCLTFLLSHNTVLGQICGGVAENFDNTAGSTAGFTGEFGYSADGTNGYLVKDKVVPSGVYSITTPTYQLPNTADYLGYGFTLAGTERIARAEIKVVYVSTLNGELTTVFLGQFVPVYDPATGKSIMCRAVQLTDLPGFPAGGKYRLRIELTPNTGNGTSSQNLIFDDFSTNGTLSQSPLPVNFIGFEAKRLSNVTVLTWKVAGEENVARYEVERSGDGRSFVAISSITHVGRDTYVYTDIASNSPVYYRIKNVDEDGKFKYSTIVRIANGRSEIVIKAFPQPVQNSLTLQYPNVTGKALISISTADGKIVRSITPSAGSMQSSVDMSGLQKGLYIVRLNTGDGNIQTIKVVKQ